jgi:Double zinc ribbon
MKCPKCGFDAQDVARFCTRCHATLRYQCPACHHEQRHSGTCDNCGVDFLKYVGAIVSAKKDQAEAIRERRERRSALFRSLVIAPFTAGLPLVRQLLRGSRKRRAD